jgi:nucleotide-binding universal stress UspA family protein
MSQPVIVAVAPTEPQEARAAIALGIRAARLLDAPLVLCAVAVCRAPGGATVVPGWAMAFDPEQAREETARAVLPLIDLVPDDLHCTVRTVAATGIVPGLEMAVEAEWAQMLVLGPSHLGRVGRALRGDVEIGLIKNVPCSMLIAPAGAIVADTWPRTVGVAWDGSPAADDALELATGLAERAHATLHILRASDPADSMVGALGSEPVLLEQAVDAARQRIERELHEVKAIASRRVACETALSGGPAAGALVAASRDLDLLVTGARRHGALNRLLLGSVSSGLAHQGTCPVLVIPLGARIPATA